MENTISKSALAQEGWGRAVAMEMWKKGKKKVKRKQLAKRTVIRKPGKFEECFNGTFEIIKLTI